MSIVNPKEVIDGIAVMCSYDKLVDIVDVIPNPRNPKQHNEKQIELLARIIKSQGWRAPITVSNRSGFVVRGHGRLMAAQKFGAQFVPIDYQDYENEAQEWADMIADNRVAELADTDEDMLKDLIQEIKAGAFDIDLDITGYSEEEINAMFNQVNIDDFFVDNGKKKSDSEPKTIVCPKCNSRVDISTGEIIK